MKARVNRKVLRTAAGLLTVLVLFLGGALLRFLWEEASFPQREGESVPPSTEEDGGALLLYEGTWYEPRTDVETVLVLGLDRSEQEEIGTTGEYAQSDLILLLELDRTEETCRVIHLNRDTMASLQDFDRYGRPNGTYMAQLTLAYAHAQAYTGNDITACQAAVKAVSELLYGVRIDHYITLTMDGLMKLNDLVGGVEVEITDNFSAVDPALVQGRRVNLMGEHALAYVRARWYVGENTNLERMERQRTYLLALLEKLSSQEEQDEDFITSALAEVNAYMASDCTVQQLSGLMEDIRAYRLERYVSPKGEAELVGDVMGFYVDEDALQRLVIQDFYAPVEEPS